MCAGTTEEKAANRCPVTSPPKQWAHREELVEGMFSVEDVAAREAVSFFEVQWRNNAFSENALGQVERVLCESLHHRIGESVALLPPVALLQCVGSILHMDRHHVFSRRRRSGERRV